MARRALSVSAFGGSVLTYRITFYRLLADPRSRVGDELCPKAATPLDALRCVTFPVRAKARRDGATGFVIANEHGEVLHQEAFRA